MVGVGSVPPKHPRLGRSQGRKPVPFLSIPMRDQAVAGQTRFLRFDRSAARPSVAMVFVPGRVTTAPGRSGRLLGLPPSALSEKCRAWLRASHQASFPESDAARTRANGVDSDKAEMNWVFLKRKEGA